MLPFFSYIHRTFFSVFFFLFFLVSFPPSSAADSSTHLAAAAPAPAPAPTPAPAHDGFSNTWRGLMRFLDADKGSSVDGMAELKRYFGRFGYLPVPPENMSFTDDFDDVFEEALILYQRKLGLTETGRLDYDTMSVIVSPRCGVGDFSGGGGGGGGGGKRVRTTARFAYFYGEPRWVRPAPMVLTYAFAPGDMIDYVSPSEVRTAFRRAFSRWAMVIPVNFTEAEDYSTADIRIGWYSGDHGDGEAFDGVLGVLAHAFSPENGRFHLDAAERWAVDFKAEKSKVAVDLESVATHEIGHVLGLAHSSVKNAIMYPSLSPRTKKVELRKDDVEAIQALYGSNPNYNEDPGLASDVSSGRGMDLERRKGLMKWTATIVMVAYFFSLGL